MERSTGQCAWAAFLLPATNRPHDPRTQTTTPLMALHRPLKVTLANLGHSLICTKGDLYQHLVCAQRNRHPDRTAVYKARPEGFEPPTPSSEV